MNSVTLRLIRKRNPFDRLLSTSPRRKAFPPPSVSNTDFFPFVSRSPIHHEGDATSTDRSDLLTRNTIAFDSNTVAIRLIDEQEPFLWSAPWLWLNDPSNIQKGSGQKLETPLTYFASGARIVGATIVGQNDVENRLEMLPRGSLHPIGGLWQSNASVKRSKTTTFNFLKVTWETKDSRLLHSMYSLDWLMEQQEGAKRGKPHQSRIGAKSSLSTVQYSHLMNKNDNSLARYQLLHAIFRDGAAIVTGVPNHFGKDDRTSPVATVGNLLSANRLSHGYLYDDVFHVETVPDAINIAYTSVALPPHQDLSYYESPPGLQLLHCTQNTNVKGGASTLIDALAAADALRTIAPSIFQTLAETNATFFKQREGADMIYHRPHIRLDATGQKVVSVHWSPPFEGPLTQQGSEQETVRQYYVAHAAFQRILDNSLPMDQYLLSDVLSKDLEDALSNYANKFTWEQQLREGEMLIFNNQRMLHGRRSFSMECPGTSRRHLVGCYTNIDESLSEYRILRREQQQHHFGLQSKIRVGNGSA